MKINEINYKWNGDLKKRVKTDMIILHHADAKECSPQDIHQWHLNRGWTGIGYHFVIRKNGQIFRGRPENMVGSHTSNYNSISIGICFEGNFMNEKPTKAQIEVAQELIAYLKNKYKISKVKRHKDLNSTDCPGKLFPFDEVANKENLILSFQEAASDDGYKFKKYGVDGIYGDETRRAMEKCIVRRRYFHKYKNCTRLVQRLLGVSPVDGLCGNITATAIRKFQIENGLVADSECGLNTWKKLLKVK